MTMLYQSTRGGANGAGGLRCGRVTFEEAIVKGIADDGGLYVPERIPEAGAGFIESLAGNSYAEVAAKVLGLFADGFAEGELREFAARAYNENTFGGPDAIPLRKLENGLYVMELYHGPTSAFKDVALQVLPQLLASCVRKLGIEETVSILVATSGDTGKAALEGFKDVGGTSIMVFYPQDGVSEIQKLQMATQEGANVAVAAVKGNFDDAQSGVKAIFADEETRRVLRGRGMRLSSANSINWGRLAPQIAYYFWAYAALIRDGAITNGDPVRFAVPTGNFGNILAGWYAREMGLPVSRFVCASNSNKVLADFIRTGVYDRNREFMVTMSPAMDILISSNLERLLYELSGRDAEKAAGLMGELASRGRYDAGPEIRRKISELFYGGFATEAETSQAIRDAFRRYGYLLDTHTAVGFHVLNEYLRGNKTTDAGLATETKTTDAGLATETGAIAAGTEAIAKTTDAGLVTVVLATASPYKFAKDVYAALTDGNTGEHDGGCAGKDAAGDCCTGADDGAAPASGPGPDGEMRYIGLLHGLSGAPVPEALRNLRGKPQLHFAAVGKGGMKEAAIEMLSGLRHRCDSCGETPPAGGVGTTGGPNR